MGVGTTPVPEVLSPRAVRRRGRDLGSVIGDIFEAQRGDRRRPRRSFSRERRGSGSTPPPECCLVPRV